MEIGKQRRKKIILAIIMSAWALVLSIIFITASALQNTSLWRGAWYYFIPMPVLAATGLILSQVYLCKKDKNYPARLFNTGMAGLPVGIMIFLSFVIISLNNAWLMFFIVPITGAVILALYIVSGDYGTKGRVIGLAICLTIALSVGFYVLSYLSVWLWIFMWWPLVIFLGSLFALFFLWFVIGLVVYGVTKAREKAAQRIENGRGGTERGGAIVRGEADGSD